jgi:ribonuclease III
MRAKLSEKLDLKINPEFNDFSKNIELLQIGYRFTNLKLLQKAMVHRSYLKDKNKHDDITEHNEKLEFLGDAVLELVSTDYLYHRFENLDEGVLTAVRSYLVNSVMLASVGLGLGLENYLYLSKGERGVSGVTNSSIVADAVEALIGAIYIDGGLDLAREFIITKILASVDEVVEKEKFRDPKTLLQEILQEKLKIRPIYTILESQGKDHDKNFKVGVFINEKKAGEGEGQSKQKAEVEAAKIALLNIQEHLE